MTALNPRADICDPKTLAVMDQAFAVVPHMLRADDLFRDCANDSELRIAISKAAEPCGGWVTNPARLRDLTVESLLLPRR